VPLIGLRGLVRLGVERVGEQAVSRSGRVIVFVFALEGIGRMSEKSLLMDFVTARMSAL